MSKEQVLDLVGKPIPEDLPVERDAIHVAVLPVRATENIKRGTWLEFAYDGDIEYVRHADTWATAVGVADPFSERNMFQREERFLMFMKPNTITGLRHEWNHPALEQAVGKKMKMKLLDHPDSRRFLQDLADECQMSLSGLITELKNVATGKEEVIYLGVDTPNMAYDPKVWEHYEKVTNRTVPDSIKRNGAPFSCAC